MAETKNAPEPTVPAGLYFSSGRRARQCSRVLLSAISAWWLTGEFLSAAEIRISSTQQQVGRYERIEFEIEAPTNYTNPFDPSEVSLTLEVTDPNGRRLAVPAFFHQPFERRSTEESNRRQTWMYPVGAGRWQARFAPAEIGQYQARATLSDEEGTRRSALISFESVPSDRSGFVRVSEEDARFFATSDGKPFFPIGQNAAFIGEGQFLNLLRTEQTFRRLSEHGANYVRIWAGCHDWAMGIEARKSAFGRSWNWDPPFAPHPDDPARQCVLLEGEAGAGIEVNPSHRVALRPETAYRLSGRVRTEDAAALEVASGGRRLAEPIRSDGENWTGWSLEFATGAGEYWLGGTHLRLANPGRAWVDSLSLVEAEGGPELLWEADPNRPARGLYNQLDCFLLDQVFAAAERYGIRIQLTLLTRDLYMNDLSDEGSPAYERAMADAKNLLRYAVGRWGYSTSLAVWEYFNEMDPGKPTTRFYGELAGYLDRIDPYVHLRSTSTWHPSPRDWQLPYLDFADEHFYLRPSSYERLRDEVDAVMDRVALLRRHAPDKPVLLGEFGLANEQWRPTEEMLQSRELVDFHNGLWASALSGASGTALFWWWERLDPRNHYPHYRALSGFLEGIPWTSGRLQTAQATFETSASEQPPAGTVEDPVVIGLAGENCAYLWIFNPPAAWKHVVVAGEEPQPVRGGLMVRGLKPGTYQVRWWHTREGRVLEEANHRTADGGLRLPVPEFERDIACRIEPFDL